MLEQFATTITPLGRERTIRLYLPDGYATDEKAYPVLYMHDGQNLYRDEDASFGISWGIAEHLDRTGLELIVVGIDCSHEGFQRLDEYAPWENRALIQALFGDTAAATGGQGKAYIDWVAQELKPLIDRRYRTVPDETAMAGSSMGGLISTYAACVYPQLFRKIASVSSAYWFNQAEIEALIQQSDLSAIDRFYMDVGTNEVTATIDSEAYIRSSTAVYGLLQPKIERLHFAIAQGAEHNEAAWRRRLPEIFGFLYAQV